MGGMGMGMNGLSPHHGGRPDGPGGMGDRPPEGGMDFPGRGPGNLSQLDLLQKLSACLVDTVSSIPLLAGKLHLLQCYPWIMYLL